MGRYCLLGGGGGDPAIPPIYEGHSPVAGNVYVYTPTCSGIRRHAAASRTPSGPTVKASTNLSPGRGAVSSRAPASCTAHRCRPIDLQPNESPLVGTGIPRNHVLGRGVVRLVGLQRRRRTGDRLKTKVAVLRHDPPRKRIRARAIVRDAAWNLDRVAGASACAADRP